MKTLLFAAILALSTTAVFSSNTKPNIVIIFTDDQGWGDIGCFGLENGKTPQLDRMASEGT